MEKLDLMKYFESVTFAQELGIEKKNKDLWLHVAERYGVEPERCTLFDDSLAAMQGRPQRQNAGGGVYDGFFAADERRCGLSATYISKALRSCSGSRSTGRAERLNPHIFPPYRLSVDWTAVCSFTGIHAQIQHYAISPEPWEAAPLHA